MGITVRAPDGRAWTVRRRFPWPRWRRLDDIAWFGDGDGRWLDFADGAGGLGALLALLALAVAVVVLTVVLLPLVVFVVELVIVAVAAAFFGRPWVVEAWTLDPPGETRLWKVRGPRASGRAVAEVARELEQGVDAAPETGEPLESGR